MQNLTIRATDAARSLYCRAYAMTATLAIAFTQPALAIGTTDLTQDTSGGKTLGDVAGNLQKAGQETATLLISLFALGGLIMVGFSLVQIHKASKDEREKPTAALVGIGVGGLLTAVSIVMYIAKNTAIGS